MNDKKIKCIKIIILLVVIGLVLVMILNKKEIIIFNNDIENIANNDHYEIKDNKLKETFNEFKEDFGLAISKTSADTLEDAKEKSIKYKEYLNKNIDTKYKLDSEEIQREFKNTNFIETEYYYKFTYENIGKNIFYDQKTVLIIFKADYFNYPYFKKYSNKDTIKKFGDILSIINLGDRKLIKSKVKDNGKSYTYEVYYVLKNFKTESYIRYNKRSRIFFRKIYIYCR